MEEFPVKKAYRFIEPGPTDRDIAGESADDAAQHPRPNIMTCGFHMVIQHEPPILGVCVGPWDASFKTLKSTKECVIAIPPVKLAEKVVDIGNCSGSDVDKFSKFGFTPLEAKKVKAPLIAECMANLECKVRDESMVKKYNLWVLDVVKGWKKKDEGVDGDRSDEKIFHHRGDGTFSVDGEIIDLQERMVLWKEFQD
ncbi:hypothetical protein PUNSTDRAFT_67939 [Punctularia strigosozonata HHB-11173 SS5]|uniref:uncharacterized protein n=1 Tax=Punctularia strigosozonata (strain HHB-11173) TaxID=741275 RepID=UPI0004416E12|nr:uncharacterized protein PUNSTDRAFT_67939 [Punctularia strigosozonata HHB-11173 SS5]EIN09094.1 hypothetical protein PUNSTDRAFT_67939 [Punctularia strigosozonata HHB-11173 SS5]